MRVLWLSLGVVALDQATKAAVVQFMASQGGISRSIPLIGDWLRLTFTENPGMAFGLTVGPPGTVTVLSLVATCLVAVYIYRVRHAYAPYLWSLALILGGAVGNIIDRVFYGVLLDYGSLFTGHVVDFIHVSLWNGFVPSAVPLIGGAYLELFPIWNVADMSIVVGVVGVLLFHRTFHERRLAKAASEADEPSRDGAEADEDDESDVAETDWPASSTTEGVPPEPMTAGDGEDREAEGIDDGSSSTEESSTWSSDDASTRS